MGALRLVLGDQLNRRISSLTDLDPRTDTVLMVEVADETPLAPAQGGAPRPPVGNQQPRLL